MLAWTLLHSAVTLTDTVFEWGTPRLLKFRIAWPEFFLKSEKLAELTADDHGNIVFPPNHSLTMNMSRCNQELVEEDGKAWDEGVLCFDSDVKPENPIMELINVHVNERKIDVKCLQVHAQ